jgi:transcriptional regulator with XRE-family HTH domain
MAERKIFAGPRVRRVRMSMGLTQAAMAAGLGISPSYLNLIERNQRPLTVQLLLKLSAVYKVDLDMLQGESNGLAAQLREVFSEPLLSGEIPGDQEIIEVAEAAPNAALGVVKLQTCLPGRGDRRRLREQGSRWTRSGSDWSNALTSSPISRMRRNSLQSKWARAKT